MARAPAFARWLLPLAVVAAPACRSTAAGVGAGATGGLTASPARHDFGAVREGESVRHTFPVVNTGSAPVRIARVERSPACAPIRVSEAPIPRGGTASVEIECDTRNRPSRLEDAVMVVATDGAAPLRLELRATIQPALTFEPQLATLHTEPGRPSTWIIHVTGWAARDARLQVLDPGAAKGLSARVLPAGDPRAPGIAIVLDGRAVGEWSDRVLVSTGVGARPELSLPYTARVRSAIAVEPAKPYFNLRDPDGRTRMLSVTSDRAGFRVLGATVVAGPFHAQVEKGGVRVTVEEAGIPAGQRGTMGKLLISSNDAHELHKEIQLFAFGPADPGAARRAAPALR
jgi:hypothetical protein